MQTDCKIKLYRGDEWIFLRLDRPRAVPADIIETEWEMWQWFARYATNGAFSVRENSVTKKREPGKFVIHQTKYPEAFWAYSHTDRELHFISRGYWGGGGLKFAEKELRFTTHLTLHEAALTKDGPKPISRSFTGKATVRTGGNMALLSHGSVVSWEYRRLDSTVEEG